MLEAWRANCPWQKTFFLGGADLDRQSPRGTCSFSISWTAGSSHYLLLPLFPIGQGLPPGKPDPPHFPSSLLCPTPSQLLFFWFVEYRALCLRPATQDHRVPCLHTRCPGTSGVISEVKQTHHYGMEPSSASGSPGSLGTELGRGKPGWGGAGN